jgi:hypothetical protein
LAFHRARKEKEVIESAEREALAALEADESRQRAAAIAAAEAEDLSTDDSADSSAN